MAACKGIKIRSEIKISGIDDLRSLRKTQLTCAEIVDYLRLHPQLERKKRDSLETMLQAQQDLPV